MNIPFITVSLESLALDFIVPRTNPAANSCKGWRTDESMADQTLRRIDNSPSILPIHRNGTCTASWDRVSVIGTAFPSHRAVGGDFYEFELDRCPGRHGRVDEPVRIVRCQHRPHRGVERCAPAAELHRITSQENVITYIGGGRIVDGESDRNQFRREYGELNRIRCRSSGVFELYVVNRIPDRGDSECHATV